MPQSKKRPSQLHTHPDYIPHKKKRKSAVLVAMVVCALFGIGIALFATGYSVTGLLIGIASGLLVGYIAGIQMDKTFGNAK